MDSGDLPNAARDGDTSDAHSTASSDGGHGTHAVGNGRGFDASGHGDVAEEPHLDEAERPFRPFSAALMNLHSKEAFMSPAELAAGHDDVSPLQQVRPPPQPLLAIWYARTGGRPAAQRRCLCAQQPCWPKVAPKVASEPLSTEPGLGIPDAPKALARVGCWGGTWRETQHACAASLECAPPEGGRIGPQRAHV